jgi:hypothetical protein
VFLLTALWTSRGSKVMDLADAAGGAALALSGALPQAAVLREADGAIAGQASYCL